MKLSNLLNPITVIIAGIVLIVGAGAGIFVALIQNTNTQLQAQQAIFDANKQYMDPSQKKQAQKAVDDANAQVAAITAQWNAVLIAKNPDIDFSDRMVAWQQYIKEVNFVLGAKIEQWLPSTGIKPTAPITLPGPPSDPNAVVAKTPIVLPLDTGSAITVTGRFPQIMAHVQKWNTFQRIVLIDGLSLSGISPFVTGTYKATVYEFPRNDDKPGPAVGSGGTAAAPTTGVPGGPPPGFGGPPPGFRPPTGPPPGAGAAPGRPVVGGAPRKLH